MKKLFVFFLMLAFGLAFSVPTGQLVTSYGQVIQINTAIGDTIRIDTLKIKQFESGAFVGDSLTPIKIALNAKGRAPNGNEYSITLKQIVSGSTTDSAQMGFGLAYCFGGVWVTSGNSVDSTKTWSNFIITNRDTSDNQLLYFRAPRDADSIGLYLHTTKTTCHTCLMRMIPNYIRSR